MGYRVHVAVISCPSSTARIIYMHIYYDFCLNREGSKSRKRVAGLSHITCIRQKRTVSGPVSSDR